MKFTAENLNEGVNYYWEIQIAPKLPDLTFTLNKTKMFIRCSRQVAEK